MMKRRVILGASALYLAIATGCSPPPTGEEKKGISGFVVETRPDTQQLLVMENDATASRDQHDAVLYSVESDTTMISDRNEKTLSFSAISVGRP